MERKANTSPAWRGAFGIDVRGHAGMKKELRLDQLPDDPGKLREILNADSVAIRRTDTTAHKKTKRKRREKIWTVVDKRLLSAWIALLEHYQSTSADKKNLPNNVKASQLAVRREEPIEALLFSVIAGTYPSPEVLSSIACDFAEYLEAKGDKSLEECFFGKPVQKSGPFSKRRARQKQEEARAIYIDILINRESDRMTLDQAAEKIAKGNVNAIDSIKRRYFEHAPKLRKSGALANPKKIEKRKA